MDQGAFVAMDPARSFCRLVYGSRSIVASDPDQGAFVALDPDQGAFVALDPDLGASVALDPYQGAFSP